METAMLGLMVLPLPAQLAAYDVSSRWTDATAFWTVVGVLGVAALCWGASDPWRRRRPGQRRTAAIVSRYQP